MRLCATCRRLWSYPPFLFCSRRLLVGTRSHSSSFPTDSGSVEGSGYPLPWAHHSGPVSPREPLVNRLIGLLLLRRIARSCGYTFTVSDFLHGAKEAVFSVAQTLSSPGSRDSLRGVLSPALYAGVSRALECLPGGARMHLDVESIRHVQLSCARSVVGATSPGDEHTLEWLGQRVVASKTELQAMHETDPKYTYRLAREIGVNAAQTHMEFELGVSFRTKEKFAVLDVNGKVLEGSNQFRDGYHLWRFGSDVVWDREDYPYSWRVTDINDYLTQSYS